MANKRLEPPNFCSTLDDLLSKSERRRDANRFAKMIVDISTRKKPKVAQNTTVETPTKQRQRRRQGAEE